MHSAAPDVASRDAILDAAERLFAEQGFARTTIKQIGAAAGVNSGRLLFRVPVLGSLPLLYLLSLAFIVASLALGLLMSTMVRSQVQAMQLSFLFLLPNILLSGFMFPRQAMPLLALWIGAALPLTYFLTILRGVLLKGIGLEHLWPEALALSGFAVGLVALSVVRFHKTIE